MTKVKDIIAAVEKLAPLSGQDSWDNSGFQVGNMEAESGGVLVCLDITPEVLDEALLKGCRTVISHHPLIFHPLKHLTGDSLPERCVTYAILNGLNIYSAHTRLDNAAEGVNRRIAEKIGLVGTEWLEPASDGKSGSGLVGTLPEPEDATDFLRRLRKEFRVECLRHSDCRGRRISKVAICGGAGGFLAEAAVRAGADCFITGEIRYHDYFDPGLILVEMGHYQSEQYTIALLKEYLSREFPHLKVLETGICTNPIQYMK